MSGLAADVTADHAGIGLALVLLAKLSSVLSMVGVRYVEGGGGRGYQGKGRGV